MGAANRSLSYRLHDALNVPLVGALSLLCIAGMLGAVDAGLITQIFTGYILLDTVWILASPSAVPRLAWAIVLHHAITLAILYHPLQHQEYHIETCRNGVVELNTFFLIVRRQLRRGSLLNRACDLAYHLTLSIRFLWQPYLIWHFHKISLLEAGVSTPLERPFLLGSQVLLVSFNCLMVLPGMLAKKKPKKA
uniref:TLC domain-containing protein n=1 Tax=Mantoniella antarctica TaxID=81844 RepID=A0A7S0SFH6_9CHLO|mmetsp:Transcript_18670/g.46406  ORF Transcript_18670/g.46406 Transcript_18670/m.46406 type:complete len:193 (+) Transcript_18670:155-733(+)